VGRVFNGVLDGMTRFGVMSCGGPRGFKTCGVIHD